jgi:hypothetical protein
VLQPLPPLRERLANDGEHAVRIGAAAILRESQLANRPRQIEPTELEQFCGSAGQNFGGNRGHSHRTVYGKLCRAISSKLSMRA